MLIFFSTLLLLLGEHRTVASAGGAPGGAAAAATIATSAAAAAVGSPTAALRKSAGFIGTVHPSRNPVPGAAIGGLKAQDVFGFGASMICNEPSIGNWTLKENIEYHCRTASVNLISGLILPPTERGQVNNPLDKDPWVPLSEKVGMIQGAARFSKISAMCPQLTGIFIDDFLQQYIGKNVTKKPTGPCYNVTCPASRGGAAGLYGSNEAGWYCCPTPHNGGHCAEAACKKESDKNCACCTDPGSKEGCQGAPRCTASPIKRKNGTIPCNQGPTGPAKITLQDMKDIKAALQGKIVDPVTGVVDHSSTALTPHLKLGIIWYDFEMVGNYNWLQKDGLLDVIEAVTPWMWHQPKSEGADYPALLQKLRKQIPANMPVYPGVCENIAPAFRSI